MRAIAIKEILIQGNKGQCDPLISEGTYITVEEQTTCSPKLIDSVMTLIQSIAELVVANQEPGEITRAITDEFSFYAQRPFMLEEYKQIINQTAAIAEQLPADIHLVLATFPILWPDGGIHNCGLYVESPKKAGEKPMIHHFSKKNHHHNDIGYYKTTTDAYELTTDANCDAQQLPNVVLSDTRLSLNDINHYQSAIKVTTSDERELIVSLGICRDHGDGLEREQVHGLIEQLNRSRQTIPLLCSHVITSSSIETIPEHILSTVSHADPKPTYRLSNTYPGPAGFTPCEVHSTFSGTLQAEIYPKKRMGVIHSDLFTHAMTYHAMDNLNTQDARGETILHQLFYEMNGDRELLAKRAYTLIINGADPNSRNQQGQSIRDLANELEQDQRDKWVERAIESAVSWRNPVHAINLISEQDQRTQLTRALSTEPINLANLKQLISRGANPYLKDKTGQSAVTLIQSIHPELLEKINNWLLQRQYGFIRPGLDPQEWFAPYIFNNLALLKQFAEEEQHLILDTLEENAPEFIANYSKELDCIKTKSQSLSVLIDSLKRMNEQQMTLLSAVDSDFKPVIEDTIRAMLCQALNLESSAEPITLHAMMNGLLVNAFGPIESEMIQSVNHIAILKYLDPETAEQLFSAIKVELIGKINNGRDLATITKHLSSQQLADLLPHIELNLANILSTADDFNNLLTIKPQNQLRTKVFDLLFNKIPYCPEMIGLNFSKLTFYREERKQILQCLLPHINKTHDAGQLVSLLIDLRADESGLIATRMTNEQLDAVSQYELDAEGISELDHCNPEGFAKITDEIKTRAHLVKVQQTYKTTMGDLNKNPDEPSSTPQKPNSGG